MPTPQTLQVADLVVLLTRKPIKTLRLRVDGRGQVQVSAPLRTSLVAISAFVARHRLWVVARQAAVQQLVSVDPGQGDVWVWGERWTLHKVAATQVQVQVQQGQGVVVLQAAADVLADAGRCAQALQPWQAGLVRSAATPLLERWAAVLQVQPSSLAIRPMRSRWGSCTPASGRICLSSELACRAPDLLEYVVVHELAHLLEANHGPRFWAHVARCLPDWAERRQRLRQPLIDLQVPHVV